MTVAEFPTDPSEPGRTRRTWTGRLACPPVLGIGVLLIGGEQVYRFHEAQATSWLTVHLLGLRSMLLTAPSAPVLYAGDAHGFDRGIALTTGCSSALLVAPFALLSGLLLAFGRRRPARILLGLVLAAALIAGTNLARLTLILAMQHRYGSGGFAWTHVLYGSLLMMGAAVAAFLLYLRLVAAPSTDAKDAAP